MHVDSRFTSMHAYKVDSKLGELLRKTEMLKAEYMLLEEDAWLSMFFFQP